MGRDVCARSTGGTPFPGERYCPSELEEGPGLDGLLELVDGILDALDVVVVQHRAVAAGRPTDIDGAGMGAWRGVRPSSWTQ